MVSAIAMLVVCYLAEKGKALEVLAGYPGFPSGHTTLATAFCAAIAFLLPKRQRILFAVPAFVMGVSVVIIKWHALPDVFGGWALGGGLTWVSLLALGSSLKKAYCNGKN